MIFSTKYILVHAELHLVLLCLLINPHQGCFHTKAKKANLAKPGLQ